MRYKYQVIAGAAVYSMRPTSFYKAKIVLERVRHRNVFPEGDFEIERVLETGTGRRYWRKVLGEWVIYPQSLKRSKELTPYEHYTYDSRASQ